MKVSFKLNKEQLLLAKVIVTEVEKETEDLKKDPEFSSDRTQFWCGNLLGYQGHSFGFNPDQYLQLLDNGVIQYQGQRHLLVQDGGLVILARIAGFSDKFPWKEHYTSIARKNWYEGREAAVKKLVVIDYQTSDQELNWWETSSNKTHRLVKQGKVTAEMLAPIVDNYCRTGWLKHADSIYLTVLDGVKPAVLGTPAYRRACAAGTQELQLLAAKYQEAKNFWN